MAKKTYVGVNNVARKVSKMYVGVNGVARKVKKAYVGVNGVAQQFYTALPKIVTWAGGTDAEIVAMVQAADEGLINLSDYWSVGDTRSVNLSSMSATNVGESHAAQTVEMVLMNAGGKTLTTATESGRTTCSFVVGMKDCLINVGGYMNPTASNSGGWNGSNRRSWCNNTFKNAFPSTLLPIFKQFENKASRGSRSSTIIISTDTFSLFAEVEITNLSAPSYGYSSEGSYMTWYRTASNRIKYGYHYWLRSPHRGDGSHFVIISDTGKPGANAANGSCGLSVYGVI